MTPAWLVIADDLTGACDTGAAFAAAGWSTRVALSQPGDFADVQVWVISTESRALPEDEAVHAVREAVTGLDLPARVYKKIDSTLRGHPGAEFAALVSTLGSQRTLVAPAFPEQGRTVVDGWVWVRGERLENTPFARDVTQPDLLRLFDAGAGVRGLGLGIIRQGVGHLAQILSLPSPAVWIADAATPADLDLLARAGLEAGIRLFCGSAGLARALVALDQPLSRSELPADFSPGPALVVAGSRSPATLIQVDMARQHGAAVFCLDSADIASPANGTVEAAVQALSAGQPVVLSAAGLADIPGGEGQVADALAYLTARVLPHANLSGLVLTGGDTASAVCWTVACTALDLGGEVRPGMVWGRFADGPFAGLPVVTKAGGFGEPDALVAAVRFLTHKSL